MRPAINVKPKFLKANHERKKLNFSKEKTPKAKKAPKPKIKETPSASDKKKKRKLLPQINRVEDVTKLIQVLNVGNRNKYQCKMCGTSCGRHNDIAMHVKIHDGTNPFHCVQCDKYFLRRYYFSLHMAKHGVHPMPVKGRDLRKKYCKHCDQSFASISQLSEHCLEVHTEVFSKQNQCSVCLKVFASRNKFVVHRMVHAEVVPWKCSGCNIQFKRRQALQKHQLGKNCGKPEDLESGSISKLPRPPKIPKPPKPKIPRISTKSGGR